MKNVNFFFWDLECKFERQLLVQFFFLRSPELP